MAGYEDLKEVPDGLGMWIFLFYALDRQHAGPPFLPTYHSSKRLLPYYDAGRPPLTCTGNGGAEYGSRLLYFLRLWLPDNQTPGRCTMATCAVRLQSKIMVRKG